jgi:hypothetical protein
MEMLRSCISLALVLIYIPAWGATYYVDATGGNDSNAGTSPNSAWKTISKVNTSSFSPGNFILFKRGETWREKLTIPSSGSADSPITFGSYGVAEAKPIINGSVDIKDGSWVNNGSNIWSQAFSSRTADVYGLWYNTSNWGIKQDNKSTINSDGDWFYNKPEKILYIYATESPSTYYYALSIDNEDMPIGIVFRNKAGKVVIDGITLKYFAKNGWQAAALVSNNSYQMVVKNSIFDYVAFGISIYGAAGGTYLVDNNTFTNGYNAQSNITTSIYDACQNATISNNTINHLVNVGGSTIKNGRGIAVYELPVAPWEVPTGVTIIGNVISNVDYFGVVGYDGTTDNVMGQDINLTISGNTITEGVKDTGDRDGIGIGGIAKSVDAAWKNIRIFQNRIDGFGNTGIHFSNYVGASSKVYYNIVSNSGGHGWGGIRSEGGSEIYNNTIYNIYDSGNTWGSGIWVDTTDGSVIKNNIIHTIKGYDPAIWAHGGVKAICSHNLTYGIASNNNEVGCKDAYLVTSDPKLNEPANGDFTLQPNSPAINAGTNVGLTRDYTGNIVPFGSSPDIGAYEYQGTSPKPGPPTNLRYK